MTGDLIVNSFLDNFKYPTEEELKLYTEESVNDFQNKANELILKDKDTLSVEEARELVKAVDQAKQNLEKVKTSIGTSDIEKTTGSFQPGQEIEKAFNNNLSTLYHSKWGVNSIGQDITVELKEATEINSLTYIPRDSGSNGNIKKAKLTIVDKDGKKHDFAVDGRENNNKPKDIDFGQAIEAKTIILNVEESYGNTANENNQFVSARELIFKLENIGEGYKAYESEDFDKLIEELKNVEDLETKYEYLYHLLKGYDVLKANNLLNDDLFKKVSSLYENLDKSDDNTDNDNNGSDNEDNDNDQGNSNPDDQDDEDDDNQSELPEVPGLPDKNDDQSYLPDYEANIENNKYINKIKVVLKRVEEKYQGLSYVKKELKESYKRYKTVIDSALHDAKKAITNARKFLKRNNVKF